MMKIIIVMRVVMMVTEVMMVMVTMIVPSCGLSYRGSYCSPTWRRGQKLM